MTRRTAKRRRSEAATPSSLAELIRSGAPVVVLTGSGLSAPSGIPTFRGPDGVWASYIMEWGTRAKFEEDPEAWWNQFWLPAHFHERTFEPNPAHHAISAIARAHPNVCVVTQNIDELHSRSGVPAAQLVEVHGVASLLKCVTNGCRYASTESIAAQPLQLAPTVAENGGGGSGGIRKLAVLPRCPACGKPALPQGLLFDETYESHAFYQYRRVRRWFGRMQALVIVGTSCAVTITLDALGHAMSRRLTVYNYNLSSWGELLSEHLAGQGVSKTLCVADVSGDCTVTLPALEALVLGESGGEPTAEGEEQSQIQVEVAPQAEPGTRGESAAEGEDNGTVCQ